MDKTQKTKEKKEFSHYLTKFPFPYIIISALIFLTYYQVLSFGFINIDDTKIIEGAHRLGGFEKITQYLDKDPFLHSDENSQFYRPIQNLSVLFDYAISGHGIYSFHLSNLIIHLFTVFCIYYLFTLLKYDRLLSLLLSVIYAVHPMFSFDVAWIPARGDLLAALFSLLSFIFFIKYLQNQKSLNLVLFFLSYIFAIFSKEIAVVLPVIYIVYYFLIVRNSESVDGKMYEIQTVTKLFIFFTWILVLFSYLLLKNIFLGLNTVTYSFGISEFIYNLRYYPEFILKFFFPVNLTGMSQFHFNLTIGGIGIIGFLSIFIVIKHKQLELSKVFFYLIWFIAFLLPVVAFKQTYIPSSEYWEHRSYLPLIGMLFFLAELLTNFNIKPTGILLFASIIIIIFIPLTMKTAKNYSQPINFFNNIIENGNYLPNAYFNRSNLRSLKGDNIGTLADLNKAIELNSNFYDALYNRGLIKEKSKNYDEAINNFTRAIEIKQTDALSYFHLGACYYSKKDFNNSILYLKKSLELDPDNEYIKENLETVQSKLNSQK